MDKHCLYWKPVICKNIRELDYECELPDLIAQYSRGRLLTEILQMPRRNPISFEEAIRLIHEKGKLAMLNYDSKLSVWYHRNFVRHISDCGYHIELTGDEFVFHLCSVDAV